VWVSDDDNLPIVPARVMFPALAAVGVILFIVLVAADQIVGAVAVAAGGLIGGGIVTYGWRRWR
jgi:hypothetical protein